MNNPALPDLLTRLVLGADSPVQGLRQARAKVTDATEGSYQALFAEDLPGSLSLQERLLVAEYASQLTPQPELAAHYLQRLQALPASEDSPRLKAILDFTRTLVLAPVEGDRQALTALLDAGLETVDVVTLGQLIAFISYQVRLASGLKALEQLR